MKKLFTLSSIFLLALSLVAQEITTEGFTPNRVRPSAIATYTIKVSNLDGTADLNGISAKLPKGLKVVDQSQQNFNNFSIENGVTKKESGVNLTLSFAADEEGTYTIGAWQAKVGDKTFDIGAHTLIVDTTAPVYVQQGNSFGGSIGGNFGSALDPFARMQQMMNAGSGRFNRQSQPAERVDLSNLVSARISLPKQKIFVGESVPCQIILEVDKSLQSRAQIELSQLVPQALDTNAFTCQELPANPVKDTSSSSEKTLYVYNTVITPNKVGSYPLSYKFQGAFGGRSFFGSSHRFEENAVLSAVEVSALPTKNVPSSFEGAIGEFRLNSVNIDPSSASVGDLITQSFAIEGIGNFSRIPAPSLASSEDWKVYEPTSDFADKDSMNFVGVKTFNYRMVAQKADLETAPAPVFSYFNPVKEEYITINVPAQKVSISPAARINSIAPIAPIQAGQFDLISDVSQEKEAKDSLFAKAEFWIYQLVIIAFIALAIVYRRRILFLRANPAIVKNSSERRAAKIHLKFAKKYAFENNAKNFFESSVKAIQYALSRTEEIQAPSITLKDAQRLLEKKGISAPEISKFFEGIDAMNYSGGLAINFNLMQLEKELNSLCKKLLR